MTEEQTTSESSDVDTQRQDEIDALAAQIASAAASARAAGSPARTRIDGPAPETTAAWPAARSAWTSS